LSSVGALEEKEDDPEEELEEEEMEEEEEEAEAMPRNDTAASVDSSVSSKVAESREDMVAEGWEFEEDSAASRSRGASATREESQPVGMGCRRFFDGEWCAVLLCCVVLCKAWHLCLFHIYIQFRSLLLVCIYMVQASTSMAMCWRCCLL
jgi:hypothetical protein